MQQRAFSFKTQDELTLQAVEWKPDSQPKACVLLVHGIGEHTGRYQHVAEYFTQAGYAITGFDLRGHGKSEGIRGHAPSFDHLMEDITQGIAIVRSNFPGLPVFLYGHSLGASLVIFYSITRDSNPAGVIATSPALGVTVPIPPAKMLLGKIMYAVFPTFQMKNGLDPNDLSRDTSVGKRYKSDSLVHSFTTARLGLDLLNSGSFNIEHASKIHWPMLLMQGSADKLVSPELTRNFAERAPSQIVTFKEWDGYYHELHNEPQKDTVLQTMIDWLDAHN